MLYIFDQKDIMLGISKSPIVTILCICINSTFAQVPQTSELFKTIKGKDSLLFELGYNQVDTKQIELLTAEDFEMYHDKQGILSPKKNFVSAMKSLDDMSYKATRELVEGSLEVYPLRKNGEIYGAIENAVSKFYGKEKGKPKYLTSTSKLSILWLKHKNQWQMKRVFSYDHVSASDAVNKIVEAPFLNDKSKVEEWLRSNKIPAVGIGIIDEGKLTQVKVYGELKDKIKAPYNTIFRTASLTKPVYALLTLKLVDNGNWKLDEPIYHYWTDPDVKNDPRHKKLTTRHILSHQTGFSNWRYMNESKKLEFDSDPGTKYTYSGEGIVYLKNALEHKFDMPIKKLMDSLIFKPLEMTDSHLYWDEKMEKSSDRYAYNHDESGRLLNTDKVTDTNRMGNLLCTIEDYSKFVTHLLEGADISKELFNEMVTPHVQTKHAHMGLGWELHQNFSNGEYVMIHTGGDPGVKTIAILLPISKQALIIFANGESGFKQIWEKLIKDTFQIGAEIWDRG